MPPAAAIFSLFLFHSTRSAAQESDCSNFSPNIIINTFSPPSIPNPCIGQSIEVNGDLSFYANHVFEDCKFKFNANASLSVAQGAQLTITNSHLFACEKDMWNGITAYYGATLTLSNCTLEDAYDAVIAKDNAILFLANNNFIENVNGIVCRPSSNVTWAHPAFEQFTSNKFNGKSLLEGTINASNTAPLTYWEIKRDLFTMLHAYPDWRPENSAAKIFYDQYFNQSIGQFVLARQAFQKAIGLTESQEIQAETINALMLDGLVQLRQLDEQISLNPQDITLQTTRGQVAAALDIVADEWNVLAQTLSKAQANSLLDVLDMYNKINAQELWEVNEKNLYTILIENTLGRSQDVHLKQLRAIAEQCPELGGASVDHARSLLPASEFIAYLKDTKTDCSERGLYARPNAIDPMKGIALSPNPARTGFEVRALDGSRLVSVTVHDMAGRMIQEYTVSAPQHYLDTTTWPDGIYFVHGRTERGDVGVAKIVVQH